MAKRTIDQVTFSEANQADTQVKLIHPHSFSFQEGFCLPSFNLFEPLQAPSFFITFFAMG